VLSCSASSLHVLLQTPLWRQLGSLHCSQPVAARSLQSTTGLQEQTMVKARHCQMRHCSAHTRECKASELAVCMHGALDR
jgi:hypothetical protein